MIGPSPEAQLGRALSRPDSARPEDRTGLDTMAIAGGMLIAGVASLIVGLYLVWVPLALIAAGVALVMASAVLVRAR